MSGNFRIFAENLKIKNMFKEFPIHTDLLLRQYSKYNPNHLVLNEVVQIIAKTEKAILFEFSEKWYDDLEYMEKYADKRFWIPKSLISMKENELKIYYIENWVPLKFIN